MDKIKPVMQRKAAVSFREKSCNEKFLSLFLFLCFFISAACAETPVSCGDLLADLADAFRDPSDEAMKKVDMDAKTLDSPLAYSIATQWKKTWLDPDYHLLLYGTDSPEEIQVTGRHAFVILGYQLENGEMTGELIGRCRAAAAASRAFPDSILICSGGSTGGNNPEKHTEAGMMKAYMSEQCGIDAERIFIDECALTTDQNMLYFMEILQAQQIGTVTVVTSDYHQLRGQALLCTLSAKVRQEQGYSVEIVGNWCWPTGTAEAMKQGEFSITLSQLVTILGFAR